MVHQSPDEYDKSPMRESMMLSQSPNCRAVASIDNFGSSVLRFLERFSPNPPEFCRFPDTDAGNGGKAGGIGGVTDPNPHPLFNNLGGDGGGGAGGGTRFNNIWHNWHNWHNWFGYNPHILFRNRSGFNHIMRFGHYRLLEIHCRSIWTLWTIRPFFSPMLFSPWLLGTCPHIQQTLAKLFFSFPQTTQSEQLNWIHFNINISPLSHMNFWGFEAFEPGCKPRALTSYPGPKASRTASRCWVSLQKENPSCVSPVTRFGQHQSPSHVSSVTHPGLGYELLRRHVSWVLSYQTPS